MEGVLGGKQLDLMSQVERGGGGPGEAASPGEDHLGVDEVQATGGDQEGIVAQREAVAEEGAVRVCPPAQRVLGAGVSNKVSGGFEGATGEGRRELLMGRLCS